MYDKEELIFALAVGALLGIAGMFWPHAWALLFYLFLPLNLGLLQGIALAEIVRYLWSVRRSSTSESQENVRRAPSSKRLNPWFYHVAAIAILWILVLTVNPKFQPLQWRLLGIMTFLGAWFNVDYRRHERRERILRVIWRILATSGVISQDLSHRNSMSRKAIAAYVAAIAVVVALGLAAIFRLPFFGLSESEAAVVWASLGFTGLIALPWYLKRIKEK